MILMNGQVEDVLGIQTSDLEDTTGKLKSLILVLPKDDAYEAWLEEKNANGGVREGLQKD